MRLLRLGILLALIAGLWFLWRGGPLPAGWSAPALPSFFRLLHREGEEFLQDARGIEQEIRHRVQMVESGATMIKEGKAIIEEGVRGRK